MTYVIHYASRQATVIVKILYFDLVYPVNKTLTGIKGVRIYMRRKKGDMACPDS